MAMKMIILAILIDDCHSKNDDDGGEDAVPGLIVCIIGSLVCISD